MEVGNLSPVEKGNILGMGYITQGVVAKRFSRATAGALPRGHRLP